MKRIIATTLLLTAFFGNVPKTFSATQGSEGATSTGTSDVTLTIPDLIKITGVADLALGSFSGSGDKILDDDIIISGNDDQATPTYSVTITSTATHCSGVQFRLNRTAPAAPGALVNMAVYWNDQTGLTNRVAVSCGAALATQGGINTTLANTTPNANLSVVLTEADLRAAPRGSYSTTLTIVVTPT